MKPNITLSNGRIVTHSLEPNGSHLATMADGGTMSNDEWNDYCAIAASENAKRIKNAALRRHEESRAAYLRDKANREGK